MWYQLEQKNKQGDIVEYSTDFDFFLKNQILVVKSGVKYKFQSRLESKVFAIDKATFQQHYNLSDVHCTDICKLIHNDILKGKYGKGNLVD